MKICLIIYKIDPNKVSEQATGYNLAKQIMAMNPNTTLITQSKHLAVLRRDPAFASVRLIGADVPHWLSFYKKGGRGIIIYYYLWQICVGRLVKRLDAQETFDVIHQLNFHTDWAPHFLKSVTAKVIWGPLLHHPQVPYTWFPTKYKKYYGLEILKLLAKRMFWHANPFLRRAIQRSAHIIFGNPDYPSVYKQANQPISVLPYAGNHWPVLAPSEKPSVFFDLLFVGRFIPLKGPHLALDAFTKFLHESRPTSVFPRLTLIGSGPLNDYVQQQAQAANALFPDSVRIIPWLKRDDLPGHYRQADYFLYPSLESQGLVVSEAIGQHCPPLTLAGTGPAFVSQIPDLTLSVDLNDYQACVKALAKRLGALYQDRLNGSHLSRTMRAETAKRAKSLTWPAIAKEIMMFYS
jgi:glycosyltransferase involved in cell wall biosynthesis